MSKMIPVGVQNVDITGGFWYERQKQNAEVTVWSVRERYEETGRFEAFRFNWKEGSNAPKPHFFWDSDVAKWMEGACYILLKREDPALKKEVDTLIDLIEKNQCEDGYFNIFHTVVEPENRFKIRDHHELYCLGHLIEAAVSYQIAFGSSRLIDILDRYIDYVIKVFVTEKTAAFVTPGHEEIELALFKLYRLTGNEKYKLLGMFFIDQRGVNNDRDLNPDWYYTNYNQSHLPVRQQFTAQGHAVRACYLYAGMADAAYFSEDGELTHACRKLFEDITRKKMYLTGGVGSSNLGEAFTVAYDLPNATAYNETCASIAMQLFSERLKLLELNSVYADITEREMYNGIISGISLDGTAFFYENPLELRLSDHSRHVSVNNSDRLPITRRQKNFGCSCCPPNMVRFIASVGGNLYSYDENGIYIHQYAQSKADINGARLQVITDYPQNGKGKITLANAAGKTLYVRIPGWCGHFTFDKKYETVNGYAAFQITDNAFSVSFDFEMKPVFVFSDPMVKENIGKVALMYGPVVYCLEGIDQPQELFRIALAPQTAAEQCELCYRGEYGVNTITVPAFYYAAFENNALYSEQKASLKTCRARFIPYFAFANRKESDMAVWINAI